MAANTTMIPESDLAIPPGEFLAEELGARGMTQLDLATRMGRPPQLVSGIVQGHKAITAATALELEDVLGLSAQFCSVSKRTTVLPLPALPGRTPAKPKRSKPPNSQSNGCRKWAGCRPAAASVCDCSTSTSVLRIWTVRPEPRHGLPCDPPAKKKGALAAWMRRGELLAEQESVEGAFDAFRAALAETRRLTTTSPPGRPCSARIVGSDWRSTALRSELPGVGVNRSQEDYRLALARAAREDASPKRSKPPNSQSNGCRKWAGCRPAKRAHCSTSTSVLRGRASRASAMAAFRATGKPAKKKGALAAWMRRGELLAEQESVEGAFDAASFRAALAETRRLTTTSPQQAVPAVRELWGALVFNCSSFRNCPAWA